MTRGPESGLAAGPRLAALRVRTRPAYGARVPLALPAARVGPRALGRLGDGTRGACEDGGRSLARGTCPDAGSGRGAKWNAHHRSTRAGPPGGDSFPRALAGGRLQGPGAHAAGDPARRSHGPPGGPPTAALRRGCPRRLGGARLLGGGPPLGAGLRQAADGPGGR